MSEVWDAELKWQMQGNTYCSYREKKREKIRNRERVNKVLQRKKKRKQVRKRNGERVKESEKEKTRIRNRERGEERKRYRARTNWPFSNWHTENWQLKVKTQIKVLKKDKTSKNTDKLRKYICTQHGGEK